MIHGQKVDTRLNGTEKSTAPPSFSQAAICHHHHHQRPAFFDLVETMNSIAMVDLSPHGQTPGQEMDNQRLSPSPRRRSFPFRMDSWSKIPPSTTTPKQQQERKGSGFSSQGLAFLYDLFSPNSPSTTAVHSSINHEDFKALQMKLRETRGSIVSNATFLHEASIFLEAKKKKTMQEARLDDDTTLSSSCGSNSNSAPSSWGMLGAMEKWTGLRIPSLSSTADQRQDDNQEMTTRMRDIRTRRPSLAIRPSPSSCPQNHDSNRRPHGPNMFVPAIVKEPNKNSHFVLQKDDNENKRDIGDSNPVDNDTNNKEKQGKQQRPEWTLSHSTENLSARRPRRKKRNSEELIKGRFPDLWREHDTSNIMSSSFRDLLPPPVMHKQEQEDDEAFIDGLVVLAGEDNKQKIRGLVTREDATRNDDSRSWDRTSPNTISCCTQSEEKLGND
mmetsp:Transcript_210/g.505  ORF Transcript_210/g.505 Transcript_210/m.505 type:complete len:443 (-) Transcript_210:1639-2967(-)